MKSLEETNESGVFQFFALEDGNYMLEIETSEGVFYDVNEKSWNASLEDIEKCITKKTKAVIMVHTFGLVSDAQKIRDYLGPKALEVLPSLIKGGFSNIFENTEKDMSTPVDCKK